MAVTLFFPILSCESSEGVLDARGVMFAEGDRSITARGAVQRHESHGVPMRVMVVRFLFGAAVDCGLVSSRLIVLLTFLR